MRTQCYDFTTRSKTAGFLWEPLKNCFWH